MAQNNDVLIQADDGENYCFWCHNDPLYRDYHAREWGWPVFDDRRLFEKISLEIFQAGLSWLTVLKKRDALRLAFANFEPVILRQYGEEKIAELMANSDIIRNRTKITAIIDNADKALAIRKEYGSITTYLWQFQPQHHNRPTTRSDMQTVSGEAILLQRSLKRMGWKFVGPKIIYAFMQAMGLVNDHFVGCHTGDKIDQHKQVNSSNSNWN